MHSHRRPTPEFALRLDRSAMQLRDMLHDRKTESGPAQFTIARLIRAVEPLKDSRQITRGNSRAIVPHAENDVAVIVHGGKADPSATRRIFYCVIEQVVDDLLESRFIASKRRKILLQLEFGA